MVPFRYVEAGESLLGCELQYVSVGIARKKGARIAESRIGKRNRRSSQHVRGRAQVGGEQRRLPVDQVIGALVGGHWPPVARSQVLEQLHAGPGRPAQRG